MNFRHSEELLNRALKVIPGGTQTFSKSVTQYPLGASPFYAAHAQGCRLTDVDGNEYVDFVSGLLAVNLGYRDPDVTKAVRSQLDIGVTLSLPTPIEIELAEKLVELIPCAEMVRFGKNGSDATSAAVRVARAYTGRDLIVVCGYHGWQDWYIGTTARDMGVPGDVKALTLNFQYNDSQSLADLFNRHRGRIAAVVMEPTNAFPPEEGFLKEVKNLCEENGSLLIFDEIITCFRFALGGCQEIYGVLPDLCALGKGIANGYPLSAVVGRAHVMNTMNDIFYSVTQGSEAASIAAGMATIDKLKRESVVDHLRNTGTRLLKGVRELINRHDVGEFISESGHPAWSFLHIKDCGHVSMWQIKTLWMQECLKRGVLCLGTHNLNYAHGDVEIDKLLNVYDEVFPILKNAVAGDDFSSYLNCNVLEPLFKVR